MKKSNSRDLKEVATHFIQDIFHRRVFNVIDLTGRYGSVNSTHVVKTDGDTFVVRLNTEESVKRFELEKWAINLAIAADVSTPPMIYVGEMDGIAVSVLPFVPGQNGKEVTNKKELWRALGEYLRKIHNIHVKGYGETLEDPDQHLFKGSFREYVGYNLESLNAQDPLLKMGVLDERTSNLLQDTFTQLSKTTFQFGLSHGDVSVKNTVVDEKRKVWLLDWGCAQAQIVPHFDFDGVLGWIKPESEKFASFLQGYGMTLAEFQLIYPQILDFSLLQATDKLRWAIDKKPANIKKFSVRLKKKIDAKLQMLGL